MAPTPPSETTPDVCGATGSDVKLRRQLLQLAAAGGFWSIGRRVLSPDGCWSGIMTGKKSSREKRRKRSGQEAAAALAAPDLVPAVGSSGSGSTSGCGSASGCGSVTCCGNTSVSGSVTGGGSGGSCWGGSSVERGERRKRRSTDSSSSVSGSLQQVRARLSRRFSKRPRFQKAGEEQNVTAGCGACCRSG